MKNPKASSDAPEKRGKKSYQSFQHFKEKLFIGFNSNADSRSKTRELMNCVKYHT